MTIYDGPEKTWEYSARWNNLRDIGNSYLAKASIAVPILGYLIIFNSEIVDFLKLHTSFCKDCSVSWRLHAFYFASSFIAVGAVFYSWRCPSLIKKYAGANDFYEAEKNYFCNPNNLEYLFGLITKAKDGEEPRDPHGLRRKIENQEPLFERDLMHLAGIMGEHYVLQNRTSRIVRLTTYVAYHVGFLILGASALITFVQVIVQLLAR